MRPRSWVRPALVAGAALTLIIAPLWLGVRYVRSRFAAFEPVARTLPAELAAAKREGLPLTPADLRRKPPVPPAENAAPVYCRIDTIYTRRPAEAQRREDDVYNAMRRRTRTPADRAKARALLAERAEIIRLAESAARLPHCDFERPYEQGPRMMLPEMATCRRLGRLLAAKAVLASDDGRLDEAMRTIRVGGCIGRQIGEDPVLIGMLLRLAVNAITDRALQQIVLTNVDDPRVTPLAGAAIGSMDQAPDYESAVRGEVVMCRLSVNMIRQSGDWGPFLPPGRMLLPAGKRATATMCNAWEARSIAYWRASFLAIRQHRGDLVGQYQALRALGDQVERNDGRATHELPFLLPDFSSSVMKVAGDEARRRLRRTLIALVAYRQTHGSYPAALSDLPVPPPPDIFTGRSLLYRGTPAGFILYSVGENLKDDGGKAKGAKDGERPDIVIQYPPVD